MFESSVISYSSWTLPYNEPLYYTFESSVISYSSWTYNPIIKIPISLRVVLFHIVVEHCIYEEELYNVWE